MIGVFLTAIGVVITLVFGLPEAITQWKKYLDKDDKERSAHQPEQQKKLLEKILATKKLKVGVIPFPPLASYTKTERREFVFQGLYIDAFRNVGERLGIIVEFIPVRNDRSLEMLQSQKVHVIACLIRTAERQNNACFPVVRHTISLNGVCRRGDDRFEAIGDLRNNDADIAAVKGEIGSRSVLDFGVKDTQLTIVETDDVSDVFHLVERGRADIAITDGITCQLYLEDTGENCGLQFAFRKNPLLRDMCGLMTRKGYPAFDEWLRNEIEASMSTAELKDSEDALLNRFQDVMLST